MVHTADTDVLYLVDVVFSAKMRTVKKKDILGDEIRNPYVYTTMEPYMSTMQDTRYAFEVEAEERGRAEGKAEGKAEGIAAGILEGTMNTLYGLVSSGKLQLSDAAQDAGISAKEFQRGMQAAADSGLSS